MMFKYPRFSIGSESWRIIDGVAEAEWCKGYVVRHEGQPETGRGETTLDDGVGKLMPHHDSFHVQLTHPKDETADKAVACIPAMLEMNPECYARLRSGEEEFIEVVVVMLTGPKGDTCEYAVHSGYLLNDEGKTVEKLFIPTSMG